jgi:hypothetical protein
MIPHTVGVLEGCSGPVLPEHARSIFSAARYCN